MEKERNDQGKEKFAEESAMGMKNYYQSMLHAVIEKWKNFFVGTCPKVAWRSVSRVTGDNEIASSMIRKLLMGGHNRWEVSLVRQ